MVRLVFLLLYGFSLNSQGIRGGEELGHGLLLMNQQQQLQQGLVQIIADHNHNETYVCTGSIIGPRLILTSAHCFDTGYPKWHIQLNEKTFDVDKIAIHKQYRREEVFDAYWNFLLEIRLHHDLALIQTKQILPTQQLALLANENDQAWLNVFMAGFGQTEHLFGIGQGEGTLRIAGPVILNEIVSPRITLKDQPVGGCLGDSGGPLLNKQNGQLFILGVLSQSDCLGQTTYQRVSQQTLAHEDFHWGALQKHHAHIIKE